MVRVEICYYSSSRFNTNATLIEEIGMIHEGERFRVPTVALVLPRMKLVFVKSHKSFGRKHHVEWLLIPMTDRIQETFHQRHYHQTCHHSPTPICYASADEHIIPVIYSTTILFVSLPAFGTTTLRIPSFRLALTESWLT